MPTKGKRKKQPKLTKAEKEVQEHEKQLAALNKFNSDSAINMATFVGLTVGIKYGLINPLSFILGQDWFPGKLISEIVDGAKDTMNEAFDNKWTIAEKKLIKERNSWVLFLKGDKVPPQARVNAEKRIVDITAELSGMPAAGSEERTAEFEAWFAENRNWIEWVVAMGMSGFAMKFAESHTVADVAELIPGQ